MSDDPRIIVSNPFVGICHMQVCACLDVTDEEILEHCNRNNPAGTSNGWAEVIRKQPEGFWGDGASLVPVKCETHPDRLHILVAC